MRNERAESMEDEDELVDPARAQAHGCIQRLTAELVLVLVLVAIAWTGVVLTVVWAADRL